MTGSVRALFDLQWSEQDRSCWRSLIPFSEVGVSYHYLAKKFGLVNLYRIIKTWSSNNGISNVEQGTAEFRSKEFCLLYKYNGAKRPNTSTFRFDILRFKLYPSNARLLIILLIQCLCPEAIWVMIARKKLIIVVPTIADSEC